MTSGNVLLALSGGIDSSVALLLLKESGLNVTGITFRVWDYISEACMEKQTGCCSVESIMEAKVFSEKQGVVHHIVDFRESFKKNVISNFVEEYLAGRTPNPCVVCNYTIKWGELLREADDLGVDKIATGHYARIRLEDGRYLLSAGKDKSKDQSYFLWMLSQEQLSRTIFPLGEYTKEEIRNIARVKGFTKLSEKRESQEICFIPDDDYRNFLLNYPVTVSPGNFVDSSGKVLGQHKGFPFYTIGQRKGLGIAMGEPWYVIAIRPESNEVVMGPRELLSRTEAVIQQVNLIKYADIENGFRAMVRIRYRSEAVSATLMKEKSGIRIIFDQPVQAITPGQSAVIYEGDDVLGGGIFSE
jgi:tRNA-specific 2-thiouridylase